MSGARRPEGDPDEMVEIGPHRTMRRGSAIALGLWSPPLPAGGQDGDAPRGAVAGGRSALDAPSASRVPPEVPSTPPAAPEMRAEPAEPIRADEVVGGFEGDCSATDNAERTLPGPARVNRPAGPRELPSTPVAAPTAAAKRKPGPGKTRRTLKAILADCGK